MENNKVVHQAKPEVKEKILKATQLKYNKNNVMQVEEFRNKCRESRRKSDIIRIEKEIPKYHVFLLEEYRNATSKHKFLCTKCNSEMNKSWNEIQQGSKCIICYPKRIVMKDKEVVEKVHKSLRETNLKTIYKFLEDHHLMILDEYINAHHRNIFGCLKCDTIFIQMWNSVQQGFTCPTCYPRNKPYSTQEKEVVEFVKSFNVEVKENVKNIISKELDIYIPQKNLAIEYCGLYWHSMEVIGDDKYHLNKLLECKDKGIRLITIFEDEWLHKKEICKSRIANTLNENSQQRIHGRECEIKEIDVKKKDDFLTENHIQGKDISKIRLGAFYKGELVSVMTFSSKNLSKGNSKPEEDVWELNRFASSMKYRVPGIASKLLNYFKENNPTWKKIYSYCDLRWSDGNLYKALGFDLKSGPLLNYWYIQGTKRIHRFNLRKTSDDPVDVPEVILRVSQKYGIIWDCGNLRFELINPLYKDFIDVQILEDGSKPIPSNYIPPNTKEEIERDRRKKISQSITGKPSKLKGRTYENIHGENASKDLKQKKRSKIVTSFLPKLLDMLDKSNISIIGEYINANSKTWFLCNTCNKPFERSWFSIKSGRIKKCPNCKSNLL